MKPVLYLLFALGACSAAWADVQIEYKGVTGANSTMFSNGNKVRVKGHFSLISSGGFNTSNGLIEYATHETLAKGAAK